MPTPELSAATTVRETADFERVLQAITRGQDDDSCECRGDDLVPYCPRHTPLPGESEPAAASPFEYPTLREQLEAALHNIDCLNVDEDENALDYYRAERAKGLLREAIEGLAT